MRSIACRIFSTGREGDRPCGTYSRRLGEDDGVRVLGFATPRRKNTIAEMLSVVVGRRGGEAVTKHVGLEIEIEPTTKLQYDDVVCEKIGEVSLGLFFRLCPTQSQSVKVISMSSPEGKVDARLIESIT